MAGIHVSANFPGGAVSNVSINGTTINFEAPLDNSPRSLWFYFSVDGCKGQRLTLIQKNLERVLGYNESRGYQPVVPVWKDGEDGTWKRVDEKTIIYSEYPFSFQFGIEPKNDTCFIAFCYPYLNKDWLEFLKTIPEKYISRKKIGISKSGRDFYRYLLKAPESKPSGFISLTARQHAGEVSGSYVLEGIIRRLTDGSDEMNQLLSKVCFSIVPFMDQDCVEEGRYGKDQAPIDYNRDWRWQPYQPEIIALQKELEELSKEYELQWAFDLHAPQPGAASYMPPARSCSLGTEMWNRMWNFAIAYEDNCKGKVSYHLSDVDTEVMNWGGMNNRALTESYFAARWHKNMLCFEYSYHRDGENRVLNIPEWHKYGEILAETIAGKIFDPALGSDPDFTRIPSWAIPPVLHRWISAQRIDGISIEELDGETVIVPLEEKNHCWLTSSISGLDQKRWMISADCDTCLKVYASFYKDGLLIDHAKEEFIYLKTGESFEWIPPEVPVSGSVVTFSIIVKDLTGKLIIH